MVRRLALLLVISTVALLAAACSGGEEAAGGTTAESNEVSIQLSWTHCNEFSGFYAAEDRGYYAEEGLSVTLMGGGYDEEGNYLDPVQSVINGVTEFGIIDNTVLLEARADGAPLVAVAAIYQRHPLALTSLAEQNIRQPGDLVGKNVHISYTSTVVFQALLASQGIDPNSVNIVDRTDFTTASLLAGDADVVDAWLTNEVVDLTRGGHAINMILPSDYGIDVYPNVIFTTEDMLANHRETVNGFVRATLRGLQETVDDVEYAVEQTLVYNEELDRDVETEAMRHALPLLKPAGSQPGMMTADVWQTSYDILVEEGILREGLDVEAAYALDFLNAYYSE